MIRRVVSDIMNANDNENRSREVCPIRKKWTCAREREWLERAKEESSRFRLAIVTYINIRWLNRGREGTARQFCEPYHCARQS